MQSRGIHMATITVLLDIIIPRNELKSETEMIKSMILKE